MKAFVLFPTVVCSLLLFLPARGLADDSSSSGPGNAFSQFLGFVSSTNRNGSATSPGVPTAGLQGFFTGSVEQTATVSQASSSIPRFLGPPATGSGGLLTGKSEAGVPSLTLEAGSALYAGEAAGFDATLKPEGVGFFTSIETLASEATPNVAAAAGATTGSGAGNDGQRPLFSASLGIAGLGNAPAESHSIFTVPGLFTIALVVGGAGALWKFFRRKQSG